MEQIDHIKINIGAMDLEIVDIKEVKKSGKKRYTRSELIEKLHQFERENKRPPEERDFSNNPIYPSYVTYYREFGNWNKGLSLAGLNLTDEKLLEFLRQFYEENGKPPTRRHFDNNPKYSSRGTYIKHFGSWSNALKLAGLDIDSMIRKGIFTTNQHKARLGEIHTLSEFKTDGAIDLSGNNRNSTCDGICPKGEMFDTKSASLSKMNGHWGWHFSISEGQLEDANYLFLRAYEDKEFTKPKYKWRIPIEFMKGRKWIFIYNENWGKHNINNMKEYNIN